MLIPKRIKHRKQHRGRMRGQAKGGTEVNFGDYGLRDNFQSYLKVDQAAKGRMDGILQRPTGEDPAAD